jgi:hypothetical protein
MYLIKEEAIINWKNYNNLTFLNCACKFTEESSKKEDNSKRLEMKKLINELRKQDKNIDYNIFKAMDNVNLECVLGTKRNGKYHSFLENYEEK